MSDELLGTHGQIVQELMDRLEALRGGDTELPRVVILQGPSGVGKTRIVRELYARLRAEASEPRYWPELSGLARTMSSGADPMAARKEVVPPIVVWPTRSLPTFGWWGFNCERLSTNVGIDVVSAAKPQLDAHLTPLLMAWRDAAGLRDQAKANWDKTLAQVRETALQESTDALVKHLESLNIVIPFSGTLLSLGWRGFKYAHKRDLELQAFRSDTDLGQKRDERRRSAGEELARVVGSLSHRNLPGILVVEDIHKMGPEVAALVDRAGAPVAESPVLVVGTMWPEGFDNGDYCAWFSKAQERRAVEVLDVPRLEESDLVTMLRWYAPATSDETASGIARQLANPHLLKLWLTLDSTAEDIKRHNGAIVLDPNQALDLPMDLERVYFERWSELPDDIRTALLLAVAANPVADTLSRFVPELIAAIVASENQPADTERVLFGLAAAVSPAQWCRLIDGIESFTEQPLADQARRSVKEKYGRARLVDLRTTTRECLEDWIDTRRDGVELGFDSRTVLVAEWLLALAEELA